MFKDKTRSRKFWTHKGRVIPKEILDFLFEHDPATGNLYRVRENDGRHIIPPKLVKAEHFNIYDSMNTRKRFKVRYLVSLIAEDDKLKS
jgi:hypothetical protein